MVIIAWVWLRRDIIIHMLKSEASNDLLWCPSTLQKLFFTSVHSEWSFWRSLLLSQLVLPWHHGSHDITGSTNTPNVVMSCWRSWDKPEFLLFISIIKLLYWLYSLIVYHVKMIVCLHFVDMWQPTVDNTCLEVMPSTCFFWAPFLHHC